MFLDIQMNYKMPHCESHESTARIHTNTSTHNIKSDPKAKKQYNIYGQPLSHINIHLFN